MVTASLKLDYLSREFLDNPYPIFAKLRSESPVVWDSEFKTPQSSGVGAWHIFKYADIQSLIRDRRISSEIPHVDLKQYPAEVQKIIAELFEITKKAMIFSDPPKHTRLRSLVGKAFNPHAVEYMRRVFKKSLMAYWTTYRVRPKSNLFRILLNNCPLTLLPH